MKALIIVLIVIKLVLLVHKEDLAIRLLRELMDAI
jgi:hypothetical protein